MFSKKTKEQLEQELKAVNEELASSPLESEENKKLSDASRALGEQGLSLEEANKVLADKGFSKKGYDLGLETIKAYPRYSKLQRKRYKLEQKLKDYD